jgi:hypothetical protein
MLTAVAYLWRQPGYHTVYTPAHVRRWAAMLRRHYAGALRLVVVTDVPGDYGDVAVVPLDGEYAALRNPWGPTFPSCYRRLRIWSADAAEIFGGDRLLLLDLDCSVLGDITPLVDRPDDVVIWQDPGAPVQPYNGGMILLRAGARPQVWDRFEGARSIAEARRRGFKGSDQAWIAHVLGRGVPVWTSADGVVSWKRHCRRGLPVAGARVVMFHGRDKPWHDQVPTVYR